MSKEKDDDCLTLQINFSEYDPDVYRICKKYTSIFWRTHIYRTEIYNEGFEEGCKEGYRNTCKTAYENCLKMDYKKEADIIFKIMLESDLDNEFISQVTKKPVEEIAKLRKGKVK